MKSESQEKHCRNRNKSIVALTYQKAQKHLKKPPTKAPGGQFLFILTTQVRVSHLRNLKNNKTLDTC